MANYKVVDSEKLDNDLKAVADSIRAKGGTIENLDFPADFVSAVGNIETGGEAKEEQEKTVEITKNGTTEVVADEGKSMSKVTVNTNVAFEGEIGKPFIDTSKITDFSYFGNSNRFNNMLDFLDTSNGTNFSRMFYMCKALQDVSLTDISKGTSFNGMFWSCGFDTLNLPKATRDLSADTFRNCTALKNLTIGEGWNVNIYLNYSDNLTVESLHGMIENLADLTGKTAKTFQIGATNLAKIDAEHLTMLQNKNWNYS